MKFCTLVVHKIRENSFLYGDQDGGLQHVRKCIVNVTDVLPALLQIVGPTDLG